MAIISTIIGTALRFTKAHRQGKSLQYTGFFGYVGFAATSFTCIGIPFAFYAANMLHFPEPVTTVQVIFAFMVLIGIPAIGLIIGAIYGFIISKRENKKA